jgi:hypothetical protein
MNANDLIIWNMKTLEQPSVVSMNYTSTEYQKIINFNSKLYKQCKDLENNLIKNNNAFLCEKSIIDKIFYKNFNTLRKEKSIHYIRKLKRLLKSFDELKTESLIISLQELTKNSENDENNGLFLLPPKESFEFIFIRLFSLLKVSMFVIRLIKRNIFPMVIKSTKNCIFLSNNILFFGAVSRVYAILKNEYIRHLTQVYVSLKDGINLFKSTDIDRLDTCVLDFQMFSTHLEYDESKSINNQNTKQITSPEHIGMELSNEQDLGECINRESTTLNYTDEIIESFSKAKRKFLKKKIFKKINEFVEFFSKRAGNDEKAQFKRKLELFLKINMKKFGTIYKKFLNDLLNDLKKLKRNIKVNVLKTKSKFLSDSLKKYIKKTIITVIKIFKS